MCILPIWQGHVATAARRGRRPNRRPSTARPRLRHPDLSVRLASSSQNNRVVGPLCIPQYWALCAYIYVDICIHAPLHVYTQSAKCIVRACKPWFMLVAGAAQSSAGDAQASNRPELWGGLPFSLLPPPPTRTHVLQALTIHEALYEYRYK